MDRRDEHSGRMEEIYEQLQSAYSQISFLSPDKSEVNEPNHHCDVDNGVQAPEIVTPGLANPVFEAAPLSGIRQAVTWLSMLTASQKKSSRSLGSDNAAKQ